MVCVMCILQKLLSQAQLMEIGHGQLYLSNEMNKTYSTTIIYLTCAILSNVEVQNQVDENTTQYFKWMLTIGYRRNVDLYV